MQHLRVAIDGPAGAGKSTVAKELARRLGITYVDTGAMYRAVAWMALQDGVDPEDEEAILNALSRRSLVFHQNSTGSIDIFVDGHFLNAELRTPEVSSVVSQLSVHQKVRTQLTEWQQAFSKAHSVVMDGRDIGTVVLPDADVKVFLTADIHERARRRATELCNKGLTVTQEVLEKDIQERDARDASREIAPLRRAPDAITIDSTGKDVDSVVMEILGVIEQVTHG